MRLALILGVIFLALATTLAYQIGYQNGEMSQSDQAMLSLMAGGR